MFYQILSITGPVFILIFIGFFVSKCNIDIHQKTLGFLLTHIGSPCLIFNALSTTNIDYIILFEIGSAAISVIFISSLLAILVIKLLKESFSPYFSCLIHPNSANLALPLSILTYGEQGLIFAIPYFVVVAFSQNTIGYMTILGSVNIFRLFYHPIFVMTFLGAFIMITKINVPEIALTSTKYLGNLVIPLSLILLGYSLPSLKVDNFKKGLIFSIARFLIGFTSAISVIYFGGFQGPQAGVIMIMSMMPVAVLNYIFTVQNDKDSNTVGGLVMISTTIMLVVLPFFMNNILNYY